MNSKCARVLDKYVMPNSNLHPYKLHDLIIKNTLISFISKQIPCRELIHTPCNDAEKSQTRLLNTCTLFIQFCGITCKRVWVTLSNFSTCVCLLMLGYNVSFTLFQSYCDGLVHVLTHSIHNRFYLQNHRNASYNMLCIGQRLRKQTASEYKYK